MRHRRGAILLIITLICGILPLISSPTIKTTHADSPIYTALYIDPTPVNKTPGNVGTTFTEFVTLFNFSNLAGFDINMTWDGSLISFVSADKTPLDTLWGAGTWTPVSEHWGTGYYELAAVALATSGSNPGASVLFTVTFLVLKSGDLPLSTPIHFASVKLSDNATPVPNPIPATVTDGMYYMSQNLYTLTVSVSPVGTGSVTLNNTGPYHYGDVVQLTAIPNIGWSFQGWSGNLFGSANPATLVIVGNEVVNAVFTQDHYNLTITIIGSGSVSKNPNQTTYTYGINVTLTASPAVGWSFVGWSGDASGFANSTNVNMTGNKTVNATFTQNVYTLTVSVSPVGTGSVTLNNTGPYHHSDAVLLTAVPFTGWVFSFWSGGLIGSANPETLIITDNVSVTATFIQSNYTLAVSVVGSGSVILNNTGPYYYGDVVLLTAVPSTGWVFSFWSGGLSGSVSPETLTIVGNVSVTATFVQINYTLTVSVSPFSSGNVTLDNIGPNYHYGEYVWLNATPSAGWVFANWSGSLVGSLNPARLTIVGNMVVTANFIQAQYTLTITTSGSGSVSKSPDQATYTYGTVVTLTASPDVGWSFAGWGGDASGTVNQTTVNMTGNKAVTATFAQNVYTLTVIISPVSKGNVILFPLPGPYYHYGDVVWLRPEPATNWVFQYWSGDISEVVPPVYAWENMTGNFTVTAHFLLEPNLQMSGGKTCRVYGENFTVAINVSNAASVKDFRFEIQYNATLLDYAGVTWNAWGSGTINVDTMIGNITGYTSGAPISGNQTLIILKFQASFHHVWKTATNWTNDLNDAIIFHWANLSYPTGPDLHYARGGGDQNQFNVGPDFAYTFSPIQGDVNNDGTVDIFDLRIAAAYFNAKKGDPNWAEASTYDLNGDGIIDASDLGLIAANFEYTYLS